MPHTVIVNILLCLPGTVFIEVRGETLARYGYVLGANGHVVEVSLIGQECHSVSRQVLSLRGSAMQLAKVNWDSSRRILKLTRASVVQAVSEDVHDLGDARFPVTAFTIVTSMEPWSRVSIEGFVGVLGEVEPSDGKQVGRWVRDITLANVQ